LKIQINLSKKINTYGRKRKKFTEA